MVETRSGKMQDPAQERIKAEESAKPQPGATIGRDASSVPVVLNPNIDIPKYDGTEDPRPWIESLEEIGFLYHWADYIISRYAAMNMTGSAKTWLNLHKASFSSWENIKIRLIQDFSLDANKEELRMKLNRMQHWNEPAIRFAEDILVLCNKVDPAMEEETKIEHVIGGLKKEYSFALYLNPPKTTDDLLVVCKKMDSFEKKYRERVEKSRNLYNGPRYSRPQQQSRYVPPTAARNYQTTSRPQAPVSNNYKNDSPPTPRQYRNNFPQPSTPRRPYNPNFVPKPNLQRNTYNKSQEVSKNRTEDGRPICFKCNKPGHVARYCRVKFIRILEEDPADTQEKIFRVGRFKLSVAPESVNQSKSTINGIKKLDPKYKLKINVDKIGTFEALVDTGADLSVVDLRTALDTGHGISKLAKICAGPDGKKLDMVGSIFLNIKIDDETLSHNFVILKTHLRTLILGRDFLKKMNAKIDCKQETIKYDLTNNHDEINFEMLKIKSAKDSIVPECSMKLIKALVETEDGEYIIEESSKMFQTNGLRLARSLINVINRETHIWITNPYPRPLKIMKNQTLAFGSSPAKINVSREREVEKNEEPRFQINENLSPKEQKELKQVLERYGDLFSSRLGRTNLAKHRIDTEDAKPIKHKPYRVSAKERDIIKEQIDEMLTEGIIRPSSSPWSFPVILVKKRDGKYRFCVDYRKLNNVTVKDVYPIPRIDEVMDTLQGSTHFSAIDLRSGYWQVEVEERDKEKTAFTTAHGLYEFNVMPFGLCNAPATFERNMENMLGNLRWQICLCYLDDVIIYSPDFPTHLKRLEAVFRCFRESNLRLNDKKCGFAFEELEILGYITSKHGIKPAEHNIKAVRNFPRPKKVKEVQSFLGMCSYYRKFIKDFSKIADPLTNLIKKSVSFTWTERQEEAFQTLKTALLSPPILGHFNPNAPTYVHTDASNIGIGATLVQDIGGEEKVISYLSRTLSKAEQNYSTTEKECLAVVWSMSKLRPYLYGRHFKIVTDHHALCWLKNLKDPTGRLARWALKIQEYDFDIIHKSGKKHLDADGLSRGPLPETDWDEDFERLFLNQITDEEDKFIESVKKNLNGSRRSIAQNFKEEDGCLFKKNPNPEGRAWLLVVPENKKREIMKEYHNHMSNGHLGVARTMYRIKSKYFWPSMLKDVSEFEKWIIVLTDYYTRYAETRAVSEATVKEVSKFLVEDIFLRHGAPQYLISDRGSQFTSNLMKEVMKTCKIKHCFTTSYHPQTDGLTERLNRTLINMLSMYVNTDQKNWDEILPFITHAYNTTIQETTGYSPFFLMFGREPTSLLDDRNISVDIDKDDYDEYIKHHLDKINRTRKLVINNTIKTQERMKKNYDKKHMERSYEPEELVAVWTPIRKIGKCEKLLRKYFGPYRLLKKLSNVNYLIEPKDNPGQDPLIVHVSRLKPYFERIDETGGVVGGHGQTKGLQIPSSLEGTERYQVNFVLGGGFSCRCRKLSVQRQTSDNRSDIVVYDALSVAEMRVIQSGGWEESVLRPPPISTHKDYGWERVDSPHTWVKTLGRTNSGSPTAMADGASKVKVGEDAALDVYPKTHCRKLEMTPMPDHMEMTTLDVQNQRRTRNREGIQLDMTPMPLKLTHSINGKLVDNEEAASTRKKWTSSILLLARSQMQTEPEEDQEPGRHSVGDDTYAFKVQKGGDDTYVFKTRTGEEVSTLYRHKIRSTRACTEGYAKQKKLKDKEKDETKLKLNSKLSESLISERFNEQDEDIWIGDSGATNHITRNASFYTSYKDFPTQQTVKVGSHEKLIAYGSGTITIETCVKGKWQTHYLTDVWYVPNFSRNVMSLQSTLDKGFEMKMDKKGCKLFKTTTGEVIVEGKRLPGGLYGMLITSIKPENAAEVNLAKTQNVNMLQLWHERFGHQNKRHVQKWLKEQGIDTVMDNEPCEACIYGKQHRLSFGSREQYASTQPGNLIHVDVCGPMQEVSKGGMRYFVCFKDDFTKYRSVYFLKEKSQVIEKLEQFILETKTTGHIVKKILTDGGKEFVNKETSKITNKYGINHRITMPYTPQQNGSRERENRTLIEAARSMIYAKNMSLKLWAEAVNTDTYVLNRTGPTQIEGKTPYELWFDKKPAVDHLRIFGTECFVHVPDEKRRKLDAKSEKGILVGYCSNKDGYRIWIPNSNKVVTSRDVIFKETIPTFSLDIEKRNKELSSNQIYEQNDTQDIEKIESNVQTSDIYNLRDRSNISKPQRYIDAEINIAEGLEPKTYKEAMDSPNAQFWKEAMNEEMNSLTENDVHECTTLPPGQKPIDCKWVLKTKLNSKGEIARYKARLVAKGFAQKKGIDYEETFSPVARHDTIRTLLAIAANEDLKLVQFDIKTAFLYGDLQDQIYIKQPEGFNNGTDLVWKLKKSLYGLKQSPRCWNQKIVNFMKERCLKESTADPCLFFRKTNYHLLIIAIYVDDGIIAGTNEQEIKEFLDELMFSFKITSEPLNYFFGIEIERQQDGSIFINQKAYIKIILEKFNMSQANKVGTPTDNSTVPGEAEILENVPFREVIGSLMHLSCLTRPDITFALNKVSQKLAASTKYLLGMRDI
ncbi:hypothetical protein LAZ67_8000616 [Cordylochernes scorpioides]|uniref:RNA-directed DNA polymerase n=1 Tax=Cordylochernes scorpioides TaxID=51811 RepID=A0ABY6KSE9_9ARAC|nr:hypothetical protein LAZ67_8000616 [Cordylochernes scorpioides]